MKPTIPLGKRFWPPADDERDEIEALFADHTDRAGSRRCYVPTSDDADR